ncbi:MAG: hypothetical protein QXI60_03065 [Thermofilaceae archaeon]
MLVEKQVNEEYRKIEEEFRLRLKHAENMWVYLPSIIMPSSIRRGWHFKVRRQGRLNYETVIHLGVKYAGFALFYGRLKQDFHELPIAVKIACVKELRRQLQHIQQHWREMATRIRRLHRHAQPSVHTRDNQSL